MILLTLLYIMLGCLITGNVALASAGEHDTYGVSEVATLQDTQAVRFQSVDKKGVSILSLSELGNWGLVLASSENKAINPIYRQMRTRYDLIPTDVKKNATEEELTWMAVGLGTDRFFPGRLVRKLSAANLDWEGTVSSENNIGFVPGVLADTARIEGSDKRVSILHRADSAPKEVALPYHIWINIPTGDGIVGVFVNYYYGTPLTTCNSMSPVPDFYYVSDRHAAYWGQKKGFLLYEKIEANPFMLDWKITSHLAAILPLSTQSFRVVSADGRMVDYDLKKETWSKMTTLPVNNILAVIKRENDWEFLIGPANNEKILRSSSTTDFKTFPEPKGTNLEMTGCETFRTAVGADLLWACATFKKAENSWQLKVASRPLESGEWSAWRTVWEGEQEPLHFDCAASTEKDFACLAVSLSLRDKDKKLVKIFRIDHDLKASDLPATPAPPPVDGQSEPSPTTPGNAAPIASDTGGSSNTSTGTGTQKPPKDGAEAAVAEATPFPWAIVIVVAIAALALGAIFTFILTRAKKTAK